VHLSHLSRYSYPFYACYDKPGCLGKAKKIIG
jgi:hypothetical protein